jgi:RNA ligase
MTQRMIKFPSIEQYRNVVHNVTSRTRYIGKDADGNAMYNGELSLPTLKFQGTVKLHGTNAGIACSMHGPMWCQSRENIITPEADNAGFAMFVKSKERLFGVMLAQAQLVKRLSDNDAMLIFGEWCGAGIQKKVGLTQLPKMFVIFGMARVDAQGEKEWFNADEVRIVCERTEAHSDTVIDNVHHIYDFPTYEIEIDFNRPHEAQNRLVEMTIAVESECPVAKQLGATTDKGPIIGEGIVWKCVTPGYEDSGNWFKVKGEAHKADKTKTKVLTSVDVERIDAIHALAEEVTPEWRLEQMYQQTFNTLNGSLPDIKGMGGYIKAVMQDVLKEELDIIAASGFTTKDITGAISKIARDYLIKQLTFKEPS